MPAPEIEELARKVVREVRDVSIQGSLRSLQPDAPSPLAKRWREAGADHESELLKMIIADTVDETISHLFRAIDQEVLRLKYDADSNVEIDLVEDGHGELGGWYAGE
jgi:hypothetical protein